MTSLIEQLTTLQAAVHQAAWAIIEVETRERGWRASDAEAARKGYDEAIAAYTSAFGIEPEMEDRFAPGLAGAIPLAKPTQQRIIELCGGEVV
jgi:hypothetical protein